MVNETASLTTSPQWPYLAAAAVLTDFAADRLLPIGAGKADIARVGAMLLEHGQPIHIGPAKGRWTLTAHSRNAALLELRKGNQLAAAIDANRHEDRADNPTQRAIDTLLSGRTPGPMASLALEELLGLERAMDLVKMAVEMPVHFREQLYASIARRRLLEPLQRLVAHGFAGRETEMRALHEYVNELPARSCGEDASPRLEDVLHIFHTRPLLVVSGPGGTGKSTLLAKFVLDHAHPGRDTPTPFIYLDFDRIELDPLQPDTLLGEALRQIGEQFPHLADNAASLAADSAMRGYVEDRLDITRSAHFDLSDKLREQFGVLIAKISHLSDSNVLLIIDTFEVVQRRGLAAVLNVLRLAAQLLNSVPRLRPVIVGRAELRERDFNCLPGAMPPYKPLVLGGFDAAAARAYLDSRLQKLRRGTVSRQMLDRIVALVHGNPLSLRLAAKAFADHGLSAIEDAASAAQFEAVFTQERLQGMLHNRIVAGLRPSLQKIADPGLIVRRLTPEVIEHVLAQPCALQLETPMEASDLFTSLVTEVSLFELVAPNVLRHRPDVRLIMLPLLRAKLAVKGRTIDEAAVRFWGGRLEPEARAEHLYHLLWLGADVATLEDAWRLGNPARSLLEEALDELNELGAPVRQRIWLSGKLDREIAPELEQQASLEEWEAHAERRVRRLLSVGALEEALDTLRVRVERTASSPLTLLEIETLKLMGRDAAALELIKKNLSAPSAASHAQVLSLFLQQAYVLERLKEADAAAESAAQAARLAKSSGDELRLFEAKLLKARLSRIRGAADWVDLKRGILEMLARPVVSEALTVRPALLRDTTAEVGDQRSDLLIRLSELEVKGRSDRRGEATSLVTVGVAHAQRGEYVAAIRALEAAYLLANELDDQRLQTRALLLLAAAQVEVGELSTAGSRLLEVHARAQSGNDAALCAQALSMLGNIEVVAGHFSAALTHQVKALEVVEGLADPHTKGLVLANMGAMYLAMGQWNDAREAFAGSRQIAFEIVDPRGVRLATSNSAIASWFIEDTQDAVARFEEAITLADTLDDLHGQACTLINRGAALALQHSWRDAEENLKKGLEMARRGGKQRAAVVALGNLAALYVRTDKHAQAGKLYPELLAAAARLGDRAAEANGLRSKAKWLRASGDEHGAQHLHDHAEQMFPQAQAHLTTDDFTFISEFSDLTYIGVSESLENLRVVADDLIHQTLVTSIEKNSRSGNFPPKIFFGAGSRKGQKMKWDSNIDGLQDIWAALVELEDEAQRNTSLLTGTLPNGKSLPFQLRDVRECPYVALGKKHCDLGIASRMVIIRHVLSAKIATPQPLITPRILADSINENLDGEAPLVESFFSQIFRWGGPTGELLTKFSRIRGYASPIGRLLRKHYPEYKAAADQLFQRPFVGADAIDEYRSWITTGALPLRGRSFLDMKNRFKLGADESQREQSINDTLTAIRSTASSTATPQLLINVYGRDMWVGLSAIAAELCARLDAESESRHVCYIPLAHTSSLEHPAIDTPTIVSMLAAFVEGDSPSTAGAPTTADEIDAALLTVRRQMLSCPAIFIFDGYATPDIYDSIMTIIRDNDPMSIIAQMLEPCTTDASAPLDLSVFYQNRIILLSDDKIEAHPQLNRYTLKSLTRWVAIPATGSWEMAIARLPLTNREEITSLYRHLGWIRDDVYRSENLLRIVDALISAHKMLGSWSSDALESVLGAPPPGPPESSVKAVKIQAVRLLYRTFQACPVWQRALLFIAAAPAGLRPSSLNKLLAEWVSNNWNARLELPLSEPEHARGTNATKQVPEPSKGIVATLRSILGLRRMDYIYGLDDSPHPWERSRAPFFDTSDPGLATVAIDFSLPELRELLLEEAPDPHREKIVRAVHAILAQEALAQQSIIMRHSGDSMLGSLRGYRRLIQAMYHGLLALPNIDTWPKTCALAIHPLDPIGTIGLNPADAWRWLFIFLYRGILERPPLWQLSRVFGADRLKLALLRLLIAPLRPAGIPDGVERRAWPRVLQTALQESEQFSEHEAKEISADYLASYQQAHYVLSPDGARFSGGRKDAGKRDIDLMLLKDQHEDAIKTSRAQITTLTSAHVLSSIERHINASADVFWRIFDELNFAATTELSTHIDSLDTVGFVQDISNEIHAPTLGEIASFLNRYAEALSLSAALAQTLPNGNSPDKMPELQRTLIKGFAGFRLASEFRQAYIRRTSIHVNPLDSGHALRSHIRGCLKLERFARLRTANFDHDRAPWGYFAQHARQYADILTHHLFQFPRDRASLLIIESSFARILASREHEAQALRCCRGYLRNADHLIQPLDPTSRIRMRLRLERSKVNCGLAQKASGADRHNFLLMARHDAYTLAHDAERHASPLWMHLATLQKTKIDALR